MGCCISYIGSLFKKKKISKKIYPLQKNIKVKTELPKGPNKKNFELTIIENITQNKSNNYMKYIIFNYNKNYIFREDNYITFRDKINKKNGISKKIISLKKTQQYIENIEYYNNKNTQEILIYENQDEKYLYTYPPSPCINYKTIYEPDYSFNKSKNNLFNREINNISNNLIKLVNTKRNNFFSKIVNINKQYK